ncbi:MAG: FkbM family methyltransferase [Caldimonas sp.]
MSNDPRDLDGKRLRTAMHQLGRDPALRAAMLALMKRAEDRLPYAGAVRDDVTGPIVDALHGDNDRYEKTLADGTRFRFLFRTKIARDFLLSDREHPSHVWEPQTTRLLLELSRGLAGDVIVGGAYFGDQAILVARGVPGGRLVHCFEPNGDQAGMLEQNVSLNRLDNVRVNRCGLWSSSDARLRLDGFDSFANAVAAAAGDPDAFTTVSIDDYRAAGQLTIGLVQLDIEGAEHAALLGAARTLEEDRPHVVFEVHRNYVDWSRGLARTDLCRYLSDLGYTLFAVRDFNSHREMGDRPVELVPIDKVYLEGPPHGFNMLAVQDVRRLDGPAFRIVENVSPKLLAHRDPALHHPIDGL